MKMEFAQFIFLMPSKLPSLSLLLHPSSLTPHGTDKPHPPLLASPEPAEQAFRGDAVVVRGGDGGGRVAGLASSSQAGGATDPRFGTPVRIVLGGVVFHRGDGGSGD